jgi:hypothetical protein
MTFEQAQRVIQAIDLVYKNEELARSFAELCMHGMWQTGPVPGDACYVLAKPPGWPDELGNILRTEDVPELWLWRWYA